MAPHAKAQLLDMPVELLLFIAQCSFPHSVEAMTLTCKRLYSAVKPLLAGHFANKSRYRHQHICDWLPGQGEVEHVQKHPITLLGRLADDPLPFWYAQDLVCDLKLDYDRENGFLPSEFFDKLEYFQTESSDLSSPIMSKFKRLIESSGVLATAEMPLPDYLRAIFDVKSTAAASLLIRHMPNLRLLRIEAPPLEPLPSQLSTLLHLKILEIPTSDQYRGQLHSITDESAFLALPQRVPSLKVLRTRAVRGEFKGTDSYAKASIPLSTIQFMDSLLNPDQFRFLLRPFKNLRRFEYDVCTFEAQSEARIDILAPIDALHYQGALEYLRLTLDNCMWADNYVGLKTRGLGPGRWSPCEKCITGHYDDGTVASIRDFSSLKTLHIDSYAFTAAVELEGVEPMQGNFGATGEGVMFEDVSREVVHQLIDLLPPAIETLILQCHSYTDKEAVMRKRVKRLFEGFDLPVAPALNTERQKRYPHLSNITIIVEQGPACSIVEDCKGLQERCGVKFQDPSERVEYAMGYSYEFLEEVNWPAGYYHL